MRSSTAEPLTLTARVAEVFDEGGESTIRLLTDPFYITVFDHADLHLGDKVELQVSVRVHEVSPTPTVR